jgi:hypothetical protein
MSRLPAPHIRTRPIRENSRISGARTGLNAHRLVAETAVEMAKACYEAHMSANNALYRAFRQNLTEKQAILAFVNRVAPTLLEEARLALTDMLSRPESEIPRALKDEIADALILDCDFRANRLKAAEHMPAGLLR